MALKIKGDVIQVFDEKRNVAVKDKDGNKTDVFKEHRFVTIQLLMPGTVVVVKAFDPPSTFVVPNVGQKAWETSIVSYRSKYLPIPEAEIF